jgi:hypothetical protein
MDLFIFKNLCLSVDKFFFPRPFAYFAGKFFIFIL